MNERKNEKRQDVIARHINMALKHSGLTMESYATNVAEHYAAAVPLSLRHIEFHHTRDPYADARANRQLIARFSADLVRMPIEIEESLVLSLPQPFRDELQRELAERLGLLAAPLPRDDHARDTVTVADLLRETGELMTALAPMLEDGRIDNNDAAHARRALAELRDVQSRCATLERLLVSVLAHDAEGHKVTRLRGAA